MLFDRLVSLTVFGGGSVLGKHCHATQYALIATRLSILSVRYLKDDLLIS